MIKTVETDGVPESQQLIDLTMKTVIRTDVITIQESDDSTTVRLRKFHSPICLRLWNIAAHQMIANQSDFMNDAVDLSKAMPGTKFLWGWRETGTTLLKLTGGHWESLFEVAVECCALDRWHLLEVKEIVTYHAGGYVTWCNLRTANRLKRVIMENVT